MKILSHENSENKASFSHIIDAVVNTGGLTGRPPAFILWLVTRSTTDVVSKDFVPTHSILAPPIQHSQPGTQHTLHQLMFLNAHLWCGVNQIKLLMLQPTSRFTLHLSWTKQMPSWVKRSPAHEFWDPILPSFHQWHSTRLPNITEKRLYIYTLYLEWATLPFIPEQSEEGPIQAHCPLSCWRNTV